METRVATKKGTEMYATPESLASDGLEVISQHTDVWSSGVLIYEMAYLKHPFHHPDYFEKLKKIKEGKLLKSLFLEYFLLTILSSNKSTSSCFQKMQCIDRQMPQKRTCLSRRQLC